MIRTYEEFKEAIIEATDHFFNPVFMSEEDEDEACRCLWDRLDYRDYAERLYMLQRDDAISVARDELDLDLRDMPLPEYFWRDVSRVIECGFRSTSEIIKKAIQIALKEVRRRQTMMRDIQKGGDIYGRDRDLSKLRARSDGTEDGAEDRKDSGG